MLRMTTALYVKDTYRALRWREITHSMFSKILKRNTALYVKENYPRSTLKRTTTLYVKENFRALC